MSDQPITIKMNEKDRTFILALSGLALFAGEIGTAVYVAVTNPSADISVLKEAILFTGGLVSTAWTWYFAKKNNQNNQKA